MVQEVSSKRNLKYNVFSVDAEEWFHVCYGRDENAAEDWVNKDSLISDMLRDCLELLGEVNTTGTFFVVGWWAERHPELVKLIDAAGHEIASHGYWHKPAYEQSIDEFKADITASKGILEDIIGKPVMGYRAPAFSINSNDIEKLAAIKNAGFLYDSSILCDRNTVYHVHDELVEIAPNAIKCGRLKLPTSGGFFFRAIPYFAFKWYVKNIMFRRQPLVFYTHTWEIVTSYPRLRMPLLLAFVQYYNLKSVRKKLGMLLSDFTFHTGREAYLSYVSKIGNTRN